MIVEAALQVEKLIKLSIQLKSQNNELINNLLYIVKFFLIGFFITLFSIQFFMTNLIYDPFPEILPCHIFQLAEAEHNPMVGQNLH